MTSILQVRKLEISQVTLSQDSNQARFAPKLNFFHTLSCQLQKAGQKGKRKVPSMVS